MPAAKAAGILRADFKNVLQMNVLRTNVLQTDAFQINAYNSNFGVVSISLFIQVHNKKKQPPGVANQRLLLFHNQRGAACLPVAHLFLCTVSSKAAALSSSFRLLLRIDAADAVVVEVAQPGLAGASVGHDGVMFTNDTLSNFELSTTRIFCRPARSIACLMRAVSSFESVTPALRSSPLQETKTLSTW